VSGTVETVACHDCDLLQRIPLLAPGAKARCARCGETLAVGNPDPINRLLALTVAAAFALIVANTMPLMGLTVVGRESSTTIIGGALEMWRQGSEITAVIVAFCAVIAPAGHVAFLLVVLLAVPNQAVPAALDGYASLHRAAIYRLNGQIRKVGINPAPYGKGVLRDAMKYQISRAVGRAQRWLNPSP